MGMRLEGPKIENIVDIQLAELQKRLGEKNILLDMRDEAKRLLAEKGYDPVFGARPLKRAIQKYIKDPLATLILDEKFKGGDKIKISTNKSGIFIFKK